MKGVNRFCLGAVLVLGLNSSGYSACYDYQENYGKVAMIAPEYNPAAGPGTYFTLKDGLTNALGGNKFYHISATKTTYGQAVYRSLEDLLVEAAKSDWIVYVKPRYLRCTANTSSSTEVEYIFVNFP